MRSPKSARVFRTSAVSSLACTLGLLSVATMDGRLQRIQAATPPSPILPPSPVYPALDLLANAVHTPPSPVCPAV